ncbi:UbiA family prenyltransferase [Paracoccus sp. 11-3]|uniref:UbiA family prenyltransferase n=1 Tax=Paracoccus amoyensis TaxID=2760093 RepID=A0A926JAX0_9RHOB|nr:UbiA family prenyltransferase [Paracoccus amoyensis]MBC9245260.1 UbiA family prenyltransferase [Paracoccus amoyensis]
MTKSIVRRLWIYQAERFPLQKTVPLLAVFSAASIAVSATLADRPLPGIGAFATGFILAIAIFFQMRVCDEHKDLEDDFRYRPDRPIPRGLVSLRLVFALGLLSALVAVVAAWIWHPQVLWLLALVWLWLGLMTVEFGAPAFLKARPVLYLVSHMAIMPLIDLLLTGIEWVPAGSMSPHLWLFLALSFVNGCVLEIGRKLWAPENEIPGVETYSGLWGPRTATRIWLGCVALSYLLLIGVGFATGNPLINAATGALGFAIILNAAFRYIHNPTPQAQKTVDNVAGLWVFLCYAVAGFAPLVSRLFS